MCCDALDRRATRIDLLLIVGCEWNVGSQAHAQRQSLVGAALGGVTGSLVYVLLGSEGAFVARVRDALGSSAALGCAAFTSVCVFLLEYGTSCHATCWG